MTRWTITTLAGLLLALAGLAPPATAQPLTSLADLLRRHDASACEGCHTRIHQEWQGSFHARSVVQALGSLRAYIAALETERKVAPDRLQMSKCLDCHAPMVNDGDENVTREIVALVKTAVDDRDEAKKKAARDQLAKLSVNCTGCHNLKGTGNPLATSPPDVMYGPRGGAAPHPAPASPVMTSSAMCAQCHALWYARDGEFLYCTTIFESHQNAYRGAGGTQSCQDCHMKARGHAFPGAHDPTLVRQGLSLGLEAIGYRHIVQGTWQPRAVVTVDVANLAGHRIPDG